MSFDNEEIDWENEKFIAEAYICGNCPYNDVCHDEPDEYGMCTLQHEENYREMGDEK